MQWPAGRQKKLQPRRVATLVLVLRLLCAAQLFAVVWALFSLFSVLFLCAAAVAVSALAGGFGQSLGVVVV